MSFRGSVVVALQTIWSSGVGARCLEAGYTQLASRLAASLGRGFHLRRADQRPHGRLWCGGPISSRILADWRGHSMPSSLVHRGLYAGQPPTALASPAPRAGYSTCRHGFTVLARLVPQLGMRPVADVALAARGDPSRLAGCTSNLPRVVAMPRTPPCPRTAGHPIAASPLRSPPLAPACGLMVIRSHPWNRRMVAMPNSAARMPSKAAMARSRPSTSPTGPMPMPRGRHRKAMGDEIAGYRGDANRASGWPAYSRRSRARRA